uniref:Secreted protein n=1 Tax=Nelumbo nucifera TaxID=4432 RepID=A0A822YL47_NELNU|nr:TPA_asm: hypothetical protein HUJ06_012078 [Nelumbo nucifera]
MVVLVRPLLLPVLELLAPNIVGHSLVFFLSSTTVSDESSARFLSITSFPSTAHVSGCCSPFLSTLVVVEALVEIEPRLRQAIMGATGFGLRNIEFGGSILDGTGRIGRGGGSGSSVG